MIRKSLYIVAVVCLLAMGGLIAGEEQWPEFRGAERDNKSPDTNLLKTWPEGGPELAWKVDGIGEGYSSVSVADGKIFTTGDVDDELRMFAFDMEGKKLWDIEIDKAWKKGQPTWRGARSTPTYDDGKLYLLSAHGKLGCYQAEDGEELWTRNLPREWGAEMQHWGYAESPLIHGDLCIVTPGGRRTAIVGLDKQTGKTKWQSPPFGHYQYSSCIVEKVGDVEMVVNGTRSGLIAVNAANGDLLWTNDFAKDNTANCPTPAYGDGYVFWAVGYGRGAVCVKVEPDGDGVKAEEVYRTKDMVNHHGGYVIDDGYVYGNHGGGYRCLDLKTGEVQWTLEGPGKGSIVWADGMLYLYGENDGKVVLAPATPGEPEIKGQLEVEGKGPSWAHPVVIGGRLYLRYGENLYCFDVAGP
jgi:outer membrane protein assembly factor BamB